METCHFEHQAGKEGIYDGELDDTNISGDNSRIERMEQGLGPVGGEGRIIWLSKKKSFP